MSFVSLSITLKELKALLPLLNYKAPGYRALKDKFQVRVVVFLFCRGRLQRATADAVKTRPEGAVVALVAGLMLCFYRMSGQRKIAWTSSSFTNSTITSCSNRMR